LLTQVEKSYQSFSKNSCVLLRF